MVRDLVAQSFFHLIVIMDSKLNSPDASSPNRTLLRDLENANSSASLGAEGKLTFASSMRSFFLDSWINLLLVFVPLGIISYVLNWSPVAVFFLNFFAIVPLSKMLGTATEEIALKTNDVIGGLLNATFGNAVELIISIIALKDGLIRVVQASLLGSILSNLLLVCGFCFFLGGLKFKEQQFNVTNAQTASSLLTLSVLAIMIPGMFGLLAEHDDGTPTDKDDITLRIISMSRGTSIVLLVVYAMYLYFQLKSHRYLVLNEQESSGEEEEEEQKMTLPAAIIGLVSVTLIISFLAEFLVSSIEGFSEKLGLSETFIGLILVPIVGNAAGNAFSLHNILLIFRAC
jgi:Ca2+:H+ antiporter